MNQDITPSPAAALAQQPTTPPPSDEAAESANNRAMIQRVASMSRKARRAFASMRRAGADIDEAFRVARSRR